MVTRSPAFKSGEIAQHGGDFIHALVEFLIGDDRGGLIFGFRDEDECGLVFVFGEMAVDAVVAGVEFAADKPFPKRRIRGIERFAPGFVPIEKLGVNVKAFRKIPFAEFFDESGIGEIRLGFEFFRRIEIFFFFPVNGDLRFVDALGRTRIGRLSISGFLPLDFSHGGSSRRCEV